MFQVCCERECGGDGSAGMEMKVGLRLGAVVRAARRLLQILTDGDGVEVEEEGMRGWMG